MLDVHPLSASFPNGTDSSYHPYDSVHHKDSVFKPAEKIVLKYFRPWSDEHNDERKQPHELLSSFKLQAHIMQSGTREHTV